jgi:hypothetical protein
MREMTKDERPMTNEKMPMYARARRGGQKMLGGEARAGPVGRPSGAA